MNQHLYQREQQPDGAVDALDGSHAYRLKSWPEIPEPFRTARVLRACSRMTLGPVTANWFLTQTTLVPAEAIRLMGILIAQGTVDRIDLGPHAQVSAAALAAAQRPGVRVRLAQRFAWKPLAALALFCLGLAAAMDHGQPAAGTIAAPELPVISG